jgi:hypothetical protein
MATQGIFERGDHVYLTTPVKVFKPTETQIEEFAFASQVKSNAPNENIVWLRGKYVEADNPNLNGAQWTGEELAIKSLTPMLMPVTVMHDPRTAVGTIADVKLLTPEKDDVSRATIDTVLALWGHRFPEAVHEAEANASAGTLMQSMECYSPWYECSVCGEVFHKLPQGAEQASWCEHLKASNPSAGFVDLGAASQTANASRILGDVCFTGTGLIFGSRGAKGAFTEANLENFEDELANHHQQVHTATATRSETDMGLVQIEQSELDTLRKERDDARSDATTAKQEVETHKSAAEEAATKLEQAEAAKVAAEEAKVSAEKERDTAKEESAQAELKDKRLADLGDGFKSKIESMPTTKSKLEEQAKTLSDDDWDSRLSEIEELASVKRDAGKSESDKDDEDKDETFTSEELASLDLGQGGGDPAGSGVADRRESASVVGKLASAFKS